MKAFACQMCGECCYGEGGIFLVPEEILQIAVFLGLDRERFLERFCFHRHGRVYIATGKDDFCIFHEKGRGCSIHPVKPGPCRKWPFFNALVRDRDNWAMAKDACPGIVRECSFEEFVREAEKWSCSEESST